MLDIHPITLLKPIPWIARSPPCSKSKFPRWQSHTSHSTLAMSSEEEKCQNFGRCLGGSLIPVSGTFIIYTRHFTCTCVRCCDPTEMGTMLRYWWIQQFFLQFPIQKVRQTQIKLCTVQFVADFLNAEDLFCSEKMKVSPLLPSSMTWPITITATTIRTTTTTATRCWRLLGMWGLQIGAKSLNDACTCHHDPGPGAHLHLVHHCAGALIILPTLWLQVREPGISLQEIDALRLSLLSCLTDVTTKSPLWQLDRPHLPQVKIARPPAPKPLPALRAWGHLGSKSCRQEWKWSVRSTLTSIITRLSIRVNLIFRLWLATCPPDQMLPPRSALEKVVEFTEHNIKVLSKVEPGLTLT